MTQSDYSCGVTVVAPDVVDADVGVDSGTDAFDSNDVADGSAADDGLMDSGTDVAGVTDAGPCAALSDGTSCDDGNACTQADSCQAGSCVGANPVVCAASDQCHGVGTCDPETGICSNPSRAEGSVCNDGDVCTQTDTCQAGVCVGANPMACGAIDACHLAGTCNSTTGCSTPSAPDGTTCPLVPGAGGCRAGACVPQCTDTVRDGAETGVDCGGGTCPGCPVGTGCGVATDCLSGACDAISLTCASNECVDHRLDGSETDVDCGGGTCPGCAFGLACRSNSDCASNACDALSQVCVADPCADHRRDGAETAVDCGGGTCPSCAMGVGCVGNSDCASNACDAVSQTCVATQCADHRQDGAETAVDCGGGTCPRCAFGLSCVGNSDCASNACDAVSQTCVATQCADHRRDGAETAVDCGGGTCSTCAIGLGCVGNSDCASNACDAVSQTCVATQCADHRRDGAETAVDCGGGTCSACAVGLGCVGDSDCASNACDLITLVCVSNQCLDERLDGSETDVDCGGPNTCARCPFGKRCTLDSDCQAGHTCDTGFRHCQ